MTALFSILASVLTISGGQLTDPKFHQQRVAVEGVISSVQADDVDPNYAWLTLRTTSVDIPVSARLENWPLERLRQFVDAEVVLTGIVNHYSAFRYSHGKRMLSLAGDTNAVQVVRAANAPFGPEARANRQRLHRQCLSGTVLAVGRGRFFLKTEDDKTLEVRPDGDAPMPSVGDDILASGFDDMSYANPMLMHAIHRFVGRNEAPPDVPVPVTDESALSLTPDADPEKGINFHGRLARLRGTLHHLPDGGAEIALGETLVRVESPDFLAALRTRAPSGSQVELTGVYLIDFKTDPVSGFQSLDHRTIIPRSPDDLRVVSLPARRILAIVLYPIGAAFAALLVFLYRGRAARRQVELKIRERTHLAVELHDSISQTLTGVSLQLENALDDVGDGRTRAPLVAAEHLITNCRAELQACLWDLKSRTFDEKSMTEACTTALRPFSRGAEVRVRFNVPLSGLAETDVDVILKIVRELVVNAIRHGGARHVRVAGERIERLVRFAVSDDGRGFDPDAAPGPADGHFGLAGVRERLRAHGGTLVIRHRPRTGMRFTVTLSTSD